MLLPRPILEAIARGEADTAYRRWRRPSVKRGGTLKTAVGVLRILDIREVAPGSITGGESRRAGYPEKAALLRELAQRPEGTLYRIRLRRDGADPRLALRENARMTAPERDALSARLDRMDASGPHGAWTRRVLDDIAARPKTPAGAMAERLRLPKEWLKTSVRKLKNLGLTISHEPGYELSPRGRALRKALTAS